MFDFFRSAEKSKRYILGGLLTLVALSMLLYLIPGGPPTSGSNGQGEVVAEVGKDTVTARDINQIVQQRLRSREVPPEMMQFLLPQFVEQRVADLAIAYEAKRRGFEVTDADLASNIRSMPNIGSLPADQYRATVENQIGMSVPEFESNIRKQMYLMQLQNLALESIIVTPQEVDQEYHKKSDQIKIEYVAFDPSKMKDQVKATPQELQAYFTSMAKSFQMPETRTAELAVVDPQRVQEGMQVSDAQLQQYYDSHKDQFRTPDRVHVRHILLMTQGKSKEDVAKIKAKADDLLKQINGGADFATVAKANSEDPGSKERGGDLDWVVRGQTVKNFENTAFALKPGEISPVITTEYGFHIVQGIAKENARLQPFDEAKTKIGEELKKGGINDKVQNLAEQAQAAIAKAPGDIEKIANQLGLTYAKADKVKTDEALPLVGTDKQLSGTIFSMKKGEVSPVIQSGNKLAIVVLDDIATPRQATFAEVESQVRDRYKMDQAQKAAADKSKRAAELLKSNGGDVAAAAKAVGGQVKTSDFFNRNGAIEGLGSATYFQDLFPKPAGFLFGPMNAGAMTVVGKVVGQQPADMSKLAAERASIVEQIKSKKAQERSGLFQDSVVTKLMEEGKVKIHRDVINRILASFRNT